MLLLDGSGQPLRAGQHRIKYEANPHLQAAGPLTGHPWLSSSTAGSHANATYTWVPGASAAGSMPHLLMTTDALLNARSIIMGPLFNTDMVRSLQLDVTTWGGAIRTTAGDGASVAMGFSDAPDGTANNYLRVFEAEGEASSMPLDGVRAGTPIVSNYRTGKSWRQASVAADTPLFDFSMRLDFKQSRIDMMTHDNVVAGMPLTAMPTGSIRPYIFWQNREGPAVSLKVLRFDVTVEY